MCVSRDTGKVRKDNDMRTENPHVRRRDYVNHLILHPVQGLERDRGGGVVRVMTYFLFLQEQIKDIIIIIGITHNIV